MWDWDFQQDLLVCVENLLINLSDIIDHFSKQKKLASKLQKNCTVNKVKCSMLISVRKKVHCYPNTSWTRNDTSLQFKSYKRIFRA